MMTPLREIYTLFRQSSGVCTDTRQLQKDQVFLALVGDRFDGNKFALEALEKGAAYSIVSDPNLTKVSARCLYQPNTLTTLQRLAAMHRSQFPGIVIGITGSNGKTTSKELLVSVLGQRFKTIGTQGNLNNHIGVPLTILSLTNAIEIAVVEMGANHRGEIKLLCAIADPDYGYITNIGQAHLEGFGSLGAIRETKFALYHHVVNKPGAGWFFLNLDEKSLSDHIDSSHPRIYSFTRNAFAKVEVAPTISFEWVREEGTRLFTSSLYGEHNVSNIVAAISIAETCGVPINGIVSGITAYQPSENRSQVISWQGRQVYLDAYNANPSSVAAALTFFNDLKAECKVLVLGDMLETGNRVKEVHREILRQVQTMDLAQTFLVGEIYASLSSEFEKSGWCFSRSLDEIKEKLVDLPSPCTLYLKASRAIGLERLID